MFIGVKFGGYAGLKCSYIRLFCVRYYLPYMVVLLFVYNLML
jgi:hypothetical protein